MNFLEKIRLTTRYFFKALFMNPRAIGAVIPSSHYLADSMSQCISKKENGLILELGPGTGAITDGILESGVLAKQLIALEISDEFAKQLEVNFPNITVVHGNATQLSSIFQHKKFDTIISSLPLRSLSKADCEKILAEIPKVLSENGKFIQFTYAIFGKEKVYPDCFKLEKSFVEWRNMPPARINVYVLKR